MSKHLRLKHSSKFTKEVKKIVKNSIFRQLEDFFSKKINFKIYFELKPVQAEVCIQKSRNFTKKIPKALPAPKWNNCVKMSKKVYLNFATSPKALTIFCGSTAAMVILRPSPQQPTMQRAISIPKSKMKRQITLEKVASMTIS